MDLQNDLEVAERIHALHHLITGSHLQSDHELKALVRHLRPVNQFANPGAFHNATLIQFRRKLNTVKEGPVLLTHFNKQYEICKAKSPYLIEPFTLLLYPLSFPVPILSTFQNLLRNSNQPSNSKKFDISKFSSLVNDQKAPASRPYQENPSLFAPNLLQINKENVQELKQIDLDILSKRVQKDVQTNLMNERGDSRTKTGNEIWISPEQEKKLIVDIIYILGGVNGTHIKFDIRSESYVVDPSLHLHPTVRDIVLCICELGWLYNRVHQYRESVTSASTSTPRGLVIQAFAYALNVIVFLLSVRLSSRLLRRRSSSSIAAFWPSWSRKSPKTVVPGVRIDPLCSLTAIRQTPTSDSCRTLRAKRPRSASLVSRQLA